MTSRTPRLDALPVCLSDDRCYAASTPPGYPAEGIPVDCNCGEARHQALKRAISSGCRRPSDILRRLARKANVALALEAVRQGLVYRADVSDPRAGSREEVVTPTMECIPALDVTAHVLSLSTVHTPKRISKPRRHAKWSGTLGATLPGGLDSNPDNEGWVDHPRETAPLDGDLLGAYGDSLGCDPGSSGSLYRSSRCVSCWDTPDLLQHREITFTNFHIRLDSSEETGARPSLRTSVKECGAHGDGALWQGTWGGDDVDLRRDPRNSPPVPIDRVMYFDHEMNGVEGALRGAIRTWVTVLEYKSGGADAVLEHDRTTKLALLNLAKRPSLFPLTEIERLVHMAYACRAQGVSACALNPSSSSPMWKHNYPDSRHFIRNGLFSRDLT